MMKEILLALHQQPIAVYPIYIDITGSMTAGVLLSQIMYWNSKMKGVEFYKSDAELMQETRLTQSEFKNAKKLISTLSFLKIERKGAPYRTYYSVNTDELLVVLRRFSSSFTYQLGSRLSTNQRGVNLRTIIGTENTQEITTEITTEITENEFSTVLIEEDEELKIEVHHIDDYFDDEPREKEKSGAKKEKEIFLVYEEPKKEKEKVFVKKEPSAQDFDLVHEVVTYLNEKNKFQGLSFRPNGKQTQAVIFARKNLDKWTLEDFKTVIDFKVHEWGKSDKMRHLLCPSTLFRACHAETYLTTAKAWKDKPNVTTQKPIIPLYREEGYSKSNVLF